ncbi:la-related protein 6-like [Odontomachus brunneus]|uniref:la-related protein 6-like n=1 Tax=Odontomachus brunneus TaxID=486640 RepID=UPI0013F2AFF3|nr:la-related protein 6-like [Odontomachus brunneus]XP_032665419.1 la-related protein 6-like [Odontomachus brunneus]XP_032665420.1 la-related protein 6-like [Odontomachus brunneus]XP_032665422.1 la-related protein 6-like [Odontomachus brunneus]XP_032665423.1 la-related protein 6-like [Odontomachus brunneus]XP_032665424.1 la-related protein 6-like [Odontomachus brunneus]XP_032665425.1 la-related protein 6-like [Odontomachus brunneus]XP_032665426.1 la-related protein 6-like [Odontomachus brunn
MELEIHQESKDGIGSLPFVPPPMKKSETRDSISSVDSDVSLSFDRRGSKGEEADLSDYDSEIRPPKEEIGVDQDSGADSLDDSTPKELANSREQQQEPSKVPVSESTADDFVPPSDDLADKICAQVEFYFSDENIVKDAFLLKHVKRNKEGYVSLKLISSFKRVKHLSRDWRVVGAALARSKKLEVNPQGTKLRRVDPLPPFDQTAPSRTILAARLPVEKLTVESVAEIFKPCGEIALIRVLRPGHPAPSEVRQAISKRPELASSEECAMVEFTDSNSARIAMQMTTLGDAKVFELHQSADKKRKHQPTKKSVLNRVTREDNYNSSSCPSGSEPEDGRMRHKKSVPGYPMYHIHAGYPFQAGPPSPDAWLSRKLSSCSVSSSDNSFMFRRLSSCSGSGSGSDTGRRYSTCSSSSETPFFHPGYPGNFYHHESRRYSCCSSTGSPMECGGGCYVTSRRGSADYGPFLRRMSTCSRDSGYDMNIRRLSLCSSGSEQNGFCQSRSNNGIAMTHLPENVTRMPSGPDGTRGFFGRSARMPVPIEPTC